MASLTEAQATPERPKELLGQSFAYWLLTKLVENPHQPNEVVMPGMDSYVADVRCEPQALDLLEPLELRLDRFI